MRQNRAYTSTQLSVQNSSIRGRTGLGGVYFGLGDTPSVPTYDALIAGVNVPTGPSMTPQEVAAYNAYIGPDPIDLPNVSPIWIGVGIMMLVLLSGGHT